MPRSSNSRRIASSIRLLAGGAGGDADGNFARWQPIARFDFLVLVLIVMADQFVRLHLGGVFDEISRQLGFAHFREVRGVGRIIAADDQQQIQRFSKKFLQGVLPVLRRAANGVEKAEMLVDFGFADISAIIAALKRRCTSSVSPRSIVV